MEDNTLKQQSDLATPFTQQIEHVDPFLDENNLKIVANVILVVGIICSLMLFFTIANVSVPNEYATGSNISYFSWTGFVTSLGTLLSTLGLSYFLKVISNISISIKDLKKARTI